MIKIHLSGNLLFNSWGLIRKKEHEGLFIDLLNDSSYTVAGEALLVLAELDSSAAFREAKRLMNSKAKGRLAQGIVVSLIKSGSEDDFDLISSKFAELEFRMRIARSYVNYLVKVQS